MKDDALATYLNDHLAGSVGAIKMIEHLIKTFEGVPINQFCKELCGDIGSDQDELRDFMRALEIKESGVRKASAWMAEKLSRPKLEPWSDGTTSLGLLQAFESLLLGIKGKEGLWRALEAL